VVNGLPPEQDDAVEALGVDPVLQALESRQRARRVRVQMSFDYQRSRLARSAEPNSLDLYLH
jgi:hypothetical protein